MSALEAVYPETKAGGFAKFDGTIQFYGRLQSLLRDDMWVLDLGAGRGGQLDTPNAFRHNLLKIKGKVSKVVGIDIDDAVLQNPWLDEAKVYDGERIPYKDGSFDLIYCDWVLEHVAAPEKFVAEAGRVLKPGGWFCARTPNSFSYLAVASRMVPNRVHAKVLNKVQAGNRQARDVFPTHYRMNSLRALRRYFSPENWEHCSYSWSSEPQYNFGSRAMVRFMSIAHYVKRPLGGEDLFVFIRKK